MSLTITFDLMCDACGHYIHVFSRDEFKGRETAKLMAEAKYYGIRIGWMVSRTTVLCPKCHEALGTLLQGATTSE